MTLTAASEGTVHSGSGAAKKRVVLWIDEINSDFLAALDAEGIAIVALIQASHPSVLSFSVHDMFHGSARLAELVAVTAPACWIDDASYRDYARCVQRVGLYPGSDFFETFSGGVTSSTDLEDWARVHLNQSLGLLESVSADEVWFCFNPHLGVDNMLALAAVRSGRTCLAFSQIKFATKFSWKRLGVPAQDAMPSLRWKTWSGGAVQPNLFYMRENDTLAWHRNLGQRIRFILQRMRHAQWGSLASRLYLAARKRRTWLAMFCLELLDRRTRPWAANRLHSRRGFDRRQHERVVVSDADALGPFVYFPLHLEPEENVHAAGGDFKNQLDAVVALHEILPAGWTLLLKENPKQTHLHRGEPFDLRLAALRHVRFASQAIPSHALIEKARLVATITGTAGYESLLTGKPCLYFGDAWYAGLPGATRFQAGLDLTHLATGHIPIELLDQAVGELLSALPDGLAHPRYAGIHRTTHDIAELYREAARSMSAISACVESGTHLAARMSVEE